MRVQSKVVLILIMSVIITACRDNSEKSDSGDATHLYNEICRTTQLYTDSMLNASDSIMLNALLTRYEERIDRLNFEVRADTDFSLTEGENDTIFQLITRLTETRRQRLQYLSGFSGNDSIAPVDMQKEDNFKDSCLKSKEDASRIVGNRNQE